MRIFQLLPLVAAPLAILTAQPLKTIPSFDVSALDRSVNPCDDFYQFACGTWEKNNPIPPDQARWGRFSELAERNREILHEILDKYSANDPKRTPVEQKIGDFYAACMDETEIEAKGTAPLKPELDRIAALADKAAIAQEVARLQKLGVNVLFNFGSAQDYKDATKVIGEVDQGGLGLPDRDYYLKTDAQSVEIRKQYLTHVQKTFELLGDPAKKAAAKAQAVMEIETALAKAALDRVSRRNPDNLYHMTNEQKLAALTPAFSWNRYLVDMGAPPIASLNVAVPEFFKQLQPTLAANSLENWKTYLAWHFVKTQSPLLPAAFVNEDFDFYGKTLAGIQQIRPRWKRCVAMTDEALGEALGQKFVERTFGAEGKQRTLKMVQALEKALGTDIKTLPWMTPATRTQALVKLHSITNKIGYPDKWRDYSKLKIVRGDALGDFDRGATFEVNRDLAKIGKPLDRSEWEMTPSTVNAYYAPQMNSINFPAGILQPPFYDNHIDDAVNFGGIGAVIGHELTHGFDDEGRKFDAKGNLRDWWTPEDVREFEKRANCFVEEYSRFVATGDVHLNGKLTLGENTADNGGVRIALMALLNTISGHEPPKIDGFTPEQRLFVSWGQIWCEVQTPETARMRATVDPHSPGKYRVNGVLSNMPEFQKAFACTAAQPMVSHNACRVW